MSATLPNDQPQDTSPDLVALATLRKAAVRTAAALRQLESVIATTTDDALAGQAQLARNNLLAAYGDLVSYLPAIDAAVAAHWSR